MIYMIAFLFLSWLRPAPPKAVDIGTYADVGTYLWVEPETVVVAPVPDRIKRPDRMTRVTPEDGNSYQTLHPNSRQLLRMDNAI